MSTTDITPDPTTARPSCARGRSPDRQRRRLQARSLALAADVAFFSLKSDRFLQTQNLSLVLQQVMVVGVLAIGQTLVILTAGIDLSVGTVMAFGQIVMTKLAVDERRAAAARRSRSGSSRASPSGC